MPTLQKSIISRGRLQVNKIIRKIDSGKIITNTFLFFSRNRGILFSVLGLLMMVIAIGVTAGTAGMASTKAGLYVLYIGKFNNERF